METKVLTDVYNQIGERRKEASLFRVREVIVIILWRLNLTRDLEMSGLLEKIKLYMQLSRSSVEQGRVTLHTTT